MLRRVILATPSAPLPPLRPCFAHLYRGTPLPRKITVSQRISRGKMRDGDCPLHLQIAVWADNEWARAVGSWSQPSLMRRRTFRARRVPRLDALARPPAPASEMSGRLNR